MFTYIGLGLATLLGVHIGHYIYKINTDASYLNQLCIQYLKRHIKDFVEEDPENLDKNIKLVLTINLNGTNEWGKHLEYKAASACIELNNKYIIIMDPEKIKKLVIHYFSDRCPYPILEAFIVGLLEHERCHKTQFKQGYKFIYDGTREELDIKKYKKDPLEIYAYKVQYSTVRKIISQYL